MQFRVAFSGYFLRASAITCETDGATLFESNPLCLRASVRASLPLPSLQDDAMTHNELSSIIINTSIDIHRKLGPGLLESVYLAVLEFDKWRLSTRSKS